MKTLKRQNTVLLLILAVMLGACGAIPKAYRGNFETPDQKSQLSLEATKGVFTTPEEILEASASSLSFKDLMKGEPGIYVRKNPVNEKLLDVFWIQPDLTTKQSAGGMIWFETGVYYSLFDASKKEEVDGIKLIYSGDGSVMLEPKTELWQIGWPAGPEEIILTRIPEQ